MLKHSTTNNDLDPKELVQEYLAHPEVCCKNNDPDRFKTSEQVFLDLVQTPAPPQSHHDQEHKTSSHPTVSDDMPATPPPDGDTPPSHAALLALYKALCEKQNEAREARGKERVLQKSRLVLFRDTDTCPSRECVPVLTENMFHVVIGSTLSPGLDTARDKYTIDTGPSESPQAAYWTPITHAIR